jgi:PKD repeat protein
MRFAPVTYVQRPKVGYLRVGWISFAPIVGLLFLVLAAPVQGDESTTRNPEVTFNTPGTKTVTLRACNGAGCTGPISRPVIVLNPMPQIQSIAGVPPIIQMGNNVNLSAQTSGRPPLTHRWLITGTAGNLTLTGNPVTWGTTSPGAGVYLIKLEVQNGDGLISSLPIGVTVISTSIFSDGFEAGNSISWGSSH